MLGGYVGSGLKDRSNGRACGSDGRWSSGSMSSFDDGSISSRGEERCKGGGKSVAD